MHDDEGPGCQLEGQQEGESIRILPGPPVSGLNHACLYPRSCARHQNQAPEVFSRKMMDPVLPDRSLLACATILIAQGREEISLLRLTRGSGAADTRSRREWHQ